MFNFKKVAVLGMGKSGLSAIRLLDHLGVEIVAVNQGKVEAWRDSVDRVIINPSVKFFSQEDIECENKLKECDLIILSPGIAREIDLLKNLTIPIWCEVELASKFVDSKILAVTGTNGKTTTVSLLEQCLIEDGREYFVGGNIGVPFCDYAFNLLTKKCSKAWLVVLELSSFQLESLFSFKADIAGILNITFSHGERYESITPYAEAKFRIFNNQQDSDFSFLPLGLDADFGHDLNKSESIHSDLDFTEVENKLAHFLDISKLKIVGIHNLKNIYFAYHLWIAAGGGEQDFIRACYNFEGVHFRLENMGKFKNLEVFNDSKSTNWEATQTAIEGVKSRGVIHLILGGQRRGHGDTRIETLVPYVNNIEQIFLIGESGKILESALKDKFRVKYVENLSGLKSEIESNDLKGVLLFSPAFPSFDQFSSYVDRGEKFRKLF